jgi:hypothetical protein
MPAPQQPSQRTFWIRRVIVLAIVVGIIWALVAVVSTAVGIVGGWFGASKAAASASAQANSASKAATDANGNAYTTCMPVGITVSAVVGDGSKPVSTFPSGSNPRFWFTVTNTGQKSCYFNVGTAAQTFQVTSGPEVIWTNTQCTTARTDYRMLLQPGVATNANPIVWERVHSSSTGCDTASGQSKATAGGASYHLQVTLNGVKSQDVQFILN